MTAAIGVWPAATISHKTLFALGTVLTVLSMLAIGLYMLRGQSSLGPHERKVRIGIAIVGDKAQLRLNVGNGAGLEIFRDDEAEQRAADAVGALSGSLCLRNGGRKMTGGDLGCRHVGFHLMHERIMRPLDSVEAERGVSALTCIKNVPARQLVRYRSYFPATTSSAAMSGSSVYRSCARPMPRSA